MFIYNKQKQLTLERQTSKKITKTQMFFFFYRNMGPQICDRLCQASVKNNTTPSKTYTSR